MPALAVEPDGDFVVAWQSYLQDGSYYGIFGQRYARDGSPRGAEFRVNTFTTGYQVAAQGCRQQGGEVRRGLAERQPEWRARHLRPAL